MSLTPQIKQKIQKLPNFLIDQIKAGEVIESPSSLIKELLENAIDAKATTIDIEIMGNGITNITISDDGEGIKHNELPLAFERHATSKITSYDDLYRLYSFGFRGEALASAASISRISCTSCPLTGEGGRIMIEGGKQLSLTPITMEQHGTTISISDLFFNTPVRMKFIKGQKSEKKSITRILFAYILSNPKITFSVKWDNEEKIIYPKINEKEKLLENRAIQIFPWLKSTDNLISFSQEYNDHSICGFLQIASSKSTTKRANYLFANHRLFTEQSYHYQITQLGKKIWKEGEQGSYIAFLTIPPQHIDVNIHPSKTRIKFAHSGDVYALLSSAIKQKIVLFQQQNPIIASHTANQDHVPQRKTDGQSIEVPIFNDGNTPLTSLTSGISSYRHKNQVYLINEQQLFSLIMESTYDPLNAEDSSVPLLITRPFSVDQDKSQLLGFLQEHGILFDLLNKQTILLKALPQLLSSLPVHDIMTEILACSNNKNKYCWKDLLPSHFNYTKILYEIALSDMELTLQKHLSKWFRVNLKAIETNND